jgi:NAD+ kinase
VNEISFRRRASHRVAELAELVGSDQLGSVRCDGLVVATPAGSTGYNLANGGPVLAWGVEGYVVSFIAPHTLTARALVVATDAVLMVQNGSEHEPVDVSTDGRIVCALEPQGEMDIHFHHDKVLLAQRPGSNFYHRLREKFGRLAY